MKLEEGMYVRHYYYGIGKITNRYENNNKTWFNVKFKCYEEDEGSCGICEQSIGIKTSHSLIDLIEVGDYVNGYLVTAVSKDVYGETIVFVGQKLIEEAGYYRSYYSKDIKTIVTKEQFESMKYEVKKDE